MAGAPIDDVQSTRRIAALAAMEGPLAFGDNGDASDDGVRAGIGPARNPSLLNPHMDNQTRPLGPTSLAATLGGLVAILLWSTSVALARSLSNQLGPLGAGAVVYLFAGFGLIGWEMLRRPAALAAMLRLPPAYLVGCGGLFVFYTATFFLALGLARNDAQSVVVGLVNYLWPALTLVLSLPILKTRADWRLVPGTALALGGVLVVVSSGQKLSVSALWLGLRDNPVAFGFALAAAISWALYSNLVRRWAGASRQGAVPLFVLVSGVLLFAVRHLQGEAGGWPPKVLLEAAVMALTVAIAYACWDWAMRRGRVTLVTACSYLTPLLSTLVSCLYLHVTLTTVFWLGCLALVVGSLVSWRAVRGC